MPFQLELIMTTRQGYRCVEMLLRFQWFQESPKSQHWTCGLLYKELWKDPWPMLILNSLVNMHFGGQLCFIQFIPLYHSSWKKWSFLPLQQSLNCLENPPPFFLEGAACLCSTWVKRRGQGQTGVRENLGSMNPNWPMLGAVRIFLQSLRLKFHIDMEVSHSWGHSWPYESSIYTWGYHQNRCFIGTPMKHPIPINGTSYKWNIHGIPSFLHLLFIILMEHPIGTSIFNRISTMKWGPLGNSPPGIQWWSFSASYGRYTAHHWFQWSIFPWAAEGSFKGPNIVTRLWLEMDWLWIDYGLTYFEVRTSSSVNSTVDAIHVEYDYRWWYDIMF